MRDTRPMARAHTARLPANAPGQRLSDYDFVVPHGQIAQHPTLHRTASRLLDAQAFPQLQHRQFGDLPHCLRAGDLLVLNDTKVIKARVFGRKASGGQLELLIERIWPTAQANTWQYVAHMRVSKKPAVGSLLHLDGARTLQLLGRWPQADGALFLLQGRGDPWTWLEQAGHLPLPPYIKRTNGVNAATAATDDARYQTVFAKHPGAVAAPTAALHFDQDLLARLQACGIDHSFLTLHVGAGTFEPVKTEDIHAHHMHAERYTIPADTLAKVAQTRARGGRIVAVGSTVLRSLESWAQHGQTEGDTRIFITPGFRFRVADVLITNFHLPKSSLLMLVAAFIGFTAMHQLYAIALSERYRFFSYGDAMLLARNAPAL